MGLLIRKFIDNLINFLRINQVSVVKVHATGGVEREDLVQVEHARSGFTNTLVNGLCKEFQEIFNILLIHDMRLTVLLLDSSQHVLPQDALHSRDSLFYLAFLRLEAGLLVHSEEPGSGALGYFQEVLCDETILELGLALFYCFSSDRFLINGQVLLSP